MNNGTKAAGPGRLGSCVFSILAAAAVAVWGGQATAQPQVPSTPLSPPEALASMRVPPGVTIELAAAEPLVVDPIAVRFDERNRMWVVEMGDYPLGPAPGQPPRSRIKVLEDRDGDGYFESMQVFAEGLSFANGVQPWNGGAWVTTSGTVSWMKDDDGDGARDREELWFKGFAQENSQLRANDPTWSIDGWIYIANGLRGGMIGSVRQPAAEEVSISGMDFRFDPLGDSYHAVSGMGQFGVAFDDFGRRFTCSNRNPLTHVVLENRYLAKTPHVAVASVAHDVAAAAEASRLFPLSRAWTTSTLHDRQFTAACGVTIYRGEALPTRYDGSAMTCDPTANLVHCEILSPRGATFRSEPERQGVEFLASPDEWFRPVNLEVGPDGALYVVDMYRAVIEHPEFMPEELQKRPDLMRGDDLGRIYRLRATPTSPASAQPRSILDPSDARQCVSALDDSNAWRRETAARLLLTKGETPPDLLEQMARQGKRAAGRAQALWILKRQGQLQSDHLRTALRDPDPGVRENALRMAEDGQFAGEFRGLMLASLRDPDPRVRFQARLSLTPARSAEIAQLARTSLGDSDDPWQRAAIRLVGSAHASLLARQLLTEVNAAESQGDGSIQLARELLLMGDPKSDGPPTLRALAAWTERSADNVAGVAYLLAAWAQRYAPGDDLETTIQTAGLSPSELGAIARAMTSARQVAERFERQTTSRDGMILELLGFHDASRDLLLKLALLDEVPARRRLAIEALARRGSLVQWRELVLALPELSPDARSAVLDGALPRPERSKLVLHSIRDGALRPADIDPIRTAAFQGHGDAEIRRLATSLLASDNPDRDEALDKYRACLDLSADPRRGLELFRKHCSSCHRVGQVGVDVAPDIADSRVKTPLQLLTDIVQPNRAVDGNYVTYAVRCVDGRAFSGIIAEENATTVTLKLPDHQVVVLRRQEIETIKSTGQSLMPEGLERNLDLQQMADLIAYIKHWRYLDGQTPLPLQRGSEF